jgi:anaerobic magnesium-protoporphyrin IX monomethyl ester cyclase
MKQYKVILVKPVADNYVINHIPTGLCYLSSYVKKNESARFDISVLTISPKNVGIITTARPDLVGFTSFTNNYHLTISIAKTIKSTLPDIKTMIGGPHITNAPWSMNKVFDYGVIGEGEETLLKLMQTLAQGGDISELESIQFFQDGQLQSNPRRPLIEPLDTIPYPDRDCIENIESIITSNHHGWFFGSKTRSLQLTTSRGCPYKCIFCQPSAMWQKLRMHSAEYIADEIALIRKKYSINAIFIEDDLFTGSKKRVSDLVDILAKKDLTGKIRYYVGARTAQIDEDWVSLFKELGVVKVEFGIESGSDTIASYLKNHNESRAVNERAIRLLNNAGISVYASFIAGAPPETMNDLKSTVNMIRWIKHNHIDNTAGINIITPLPGTGMWEFAVGNGMINPENFDWNRLAARSGMPKQSDKIIFLNENIPRQKLIRTIRRTNLMMRLGSPREFVRALPRRTIKLLKMLTSKKQTR